MTNYETKANVERVASILSESKYDELFPIRDSMFTYTNFLKAVECHDHSLKEEQRTVQAQNSCGKQNVPYVWSTSFLQTMYRQDAAAMLADGYTNRPLFPRGHIINASWWNIAHAKNDMKEPNQQALWMVRSKTENPVLTGPKQRMPTQSDTFETDKKHYAPRHYTKTIQQIFPPKRADATMHLPLRAWKRGRRNGVRLWIFT